ncbi:MAG: hypothetical protein H0T78_04170 [Longispora sp.]|nr:hypothetical protein [Longispora sp. (in: high G+C Gram-positive bacteria)]
MSWRFEPSVVDEVAAYAAQTRRTVNDGALWLLEQALKAAAASGEYTPKSGGGQHKQAA